MKLKTVKVIGFWINRLTKNEDLRQDLWVHYLSGNTIDSLSSHLKDISTEYSDEQNTRDAIWQLINNSPSDRLIAFLNEFTDFEKSLICSLMLGSSIEQMASRCKISEVRIRQSISAIRYNPLWENYNGIKDKLNT